MCGIAGCVMPPGERPDANALGRMAAVLAPRGPDGEGVEVWENVGLVNRRLAIVDPGPSGAQPMADPDRRWLLSFNGEVYNHLRLRDDLPADRWRGHSDTESLCRALAAWGPEAVERCNGPLAIAALDRDERRLVLARDRFGKKPLYVARERGALWFASEMRALLAAGLTAAADVEVLAHMATRGWACGSATPLRGVWRLGPGTTVTVGLDTLSTSERSWYDPAEEVDPELAEQLARSPRSRLADLLEAELRASVTRRLMADVPLGTLCSGGLDSSLVTALAREEQRDVTTFACALPDEPRRLNEARWAERTARALDIELVTTEMTPATFRAELVRTVLRHEYPLAGPSAVPISQMAELARERGVKVLLTGEGADELFAGYGHLNREPMRRFLPCWLTLYRDLAGVSIYGREGLETLRRSYLPGGRAGTRFPFAAAPGSVELERRLGAAATRAYDHHRGAAAEVEAGLLAQLTCSAFPFLLNRMDKDALGSSVETRLPFLDPAVVRLALNLPLRARAYPRVKGVLRDVGLRHLPAATARRPKQPGMVFDARQRIAEAAHPEFLRDGLLRQVLQVDARRWQGLTETAGPRVGFRLWTGEVWARLFIGGSSIAQVESELWATGPG